jgi:hypothetical protein
MSFRCTVCGKLHDDLPDIAADKPDHWWGVPEEERGRRIQLASDTCIIDGEDHFIRGVLELPIHDHPQRFGFGVWVSQKRENFQTYLRHPDSADIGPFFGWLCTRIAYYPPDTLMLKTRAHFRGGNLRPAIELEPTDHPLAVDQREGITLAKAWEIVHYYEKPDRGSSGRAR